MIISLLLFVAVVVNADVFDADKACAEPFTPKIIQVQVVADGSANVYDIQEYLILNPVSTGSLDKVYCGDTWIKGYGEAGKMYIDTLSGMTCDLSQQDTCYDATYMITHTIVGMYPIGGSSVTALREALWAGAGVVTAIGFMVVMASVTAAAFYYTHRTQSVSVDKL